MYITVKRVYKKYWEYDSDMSLLIRELARDAWLSHPNAYIIELLRFIELWRVAQTGRVLDAA